MRRNHYDVTDTVCIAQPRAVETAVIDLFEDLEPGFDARALRQAFLLFSQLFSGRLAGYRGCDTRYHDAQHSLDCTLAYARLFHGHERSVEASVRLGLRRGQLGVMIALFHDTGYILRKTDTADTGAAYTLTHVSRSAEFLRQHLPRLGFGAEAALAARIVHFTGYEIHLDDIDVRDPRDRRLGYFLGTADLMAQTSDRCYPEKCRDYLYQEFLACGLAGTATGDGAAPVYDSVDALMSGTAAFNERMRVDRLDGAFESVHRYFDKHFSVPNPYRAAIDDNLRRVEAARRQGNDWSALRRRPVAITREPLRALLRAPGLSKWSPPSASTSGRRAATWTS